jgi:hypothetical protein
VSKQLDQRVNDFEPLCIPLKLLGLRMQDALERAYTRDVEGSRAEAIKLYRLGLSIIYEGLSITLPATGLGAAFHHVAAWRRDMNKWQQLALERYAACFRVLS